MAVGWLVSLVLANATAGAGVRARGLRGHRPRGRGGHGTVVRHPSREKSRAARSGRGAPLRIGAAESTGSMPFFEAIRLALQTIRAQKLKSAFSIIGVFIGVMFLIAVVSVVQGMNRYMTDKFAGTILGVNTFRLRQFPTCSSQRHRLDMACVAPPAPGDLRGRAGRDARRDHPVSPRGSRAPAPRSRRVAGRPRTWRSRPRRSSTSRFAPSGSSGAAPSPRRRSRPACRSSCWATSWRTSCSRARIRSAAR